MSLGQPTRVGEQPKSAPRRLMPDQISEIRAQQSNVESFNDAGNVRRLTTVPGAQTSYLEKPVQLVAVPQPGGWSPQRPGEASASFHAQQRLDSSRLLQRCTSDGSVRDTERDWPRGGRSFANVSRRRPGELERPRRTRVTSFQRACRQLIRPTS